MLRDVLIDEITINAKFNNLYQPLEVMWIINWRKADSEVNKNKVLDLCILINFLLVFDIGIIVSDYFFKGLG